MTLQDVLCHNLRMVVQYAAKPSSCLRLDALGQVAERKFYHFFESAQPEELGWLINANVRQIAQLRRKDFIHPKTRAVTELFIAAHQYNQALANGREALFTELKLNPIINRRVAELNPLKIVMASHEMMGHEDFPIKVYSGSSFVYRYNRDDAAIDHSREARDIFLSTQKERLISLSGKVCAYFGIGRGFFADYHYFRKAEDLHPELIYSQGPLELAEMRPSVYWLGHATCLISVPVISNKGKKVKVNLITDPVEGDLNALFYPRQTEIARTVDNCPGLHVFMLSHNHLDHYSKPTIQKLLTQQPMMLVPEGDGERFIQMGFTWVFEHNWWEQTTICFQQGEHEFDLSITATPAHHWAGQGPFGGHQSGFVGYVIHSKEHGDIYYAGDTARLSTNHIDALRNNFDIRCMFQPGGPDEKREQMESTHQASVDGLSIHFDLLVTKAYQYFKGKTARGFMKYCRQLKTIYMHTKTYKLGNLHFDDTDVGVEKIKSALRGHPVELKPYEQKVYLELLDLASRLRFNGMPLTSKQICRIIDQTVIVPKIGQFVFL